MNPTLLDPPALYHHAAQRGQVIVASKGTGAPQLATLIAWTASKARVRFPHGSHASIPHASVLDVITESETHQ